MYGFALLCCVTFQVIQFFLALQMAVLSEKLLKELPDDARVISCRFPILDWPVQSSIGSGLDQTFAYDIGIVRAHLRKAPEAEG